MYLSAVGWKFIQEIGVDSLVALTSLIISFWALYATILKRGKLQIMLYTLARDAEFHPMSKFQGVNDSFLIRMPLIVSNRGAGPVAVKNLVWRVESPEYVTIDVDVSMGDHNFSHFSVIKPYEQQIGELRLICKARGHGTGHNNEYTKTLSEVKTNLKRISIKLKCSYQICGKRSMEKKEIIFDISNLVSEYLIKNY